MAALATRRVFSLAQRGGGNIGRAKRLLTDEKYAALLERAADLCGKMEKSDWFGILQVLAGFENDREGLLQCLEEIRQLLAKNTKASFVAKSYR